MLKTLIIILNPFFHFQIMYNILKKFKSVLLKNLIFYKHHSFFQRNPWGAVRIMMTDSNIDIKKSTVIHDFVDLFAEKNSQIEIAEHCKIGQRTQIVSHKGNHLKIGAGTSFHSDCSIVGQICIGRNCIFARHIFVSSFDHHFNKEPHLTIRQQDQKYGPESKAVVIDEDCWLGWGVAVRSGIHIGKGAIVGANSVVTKNLKPYRIYGGVPAREIGVRLNFQPPSQLNSQNPEHLPYFYAGFDANQTVALNWSLASPLLKMGSLKIRTLEKNSELKVSLIIEGQAWPLTTSDHQVFSIELKPSSSEEDYVILNFQSNLNFKIAEVMFPC